VSFEMDLGHGVTMTWLTKDGERIGLVECHTEPDGDECIGSVIFNVPAAHAARPDGPFWQVESWEPLTLSPSIACRTCSNHGYIRQGQWVPA
jgi:hypothetical protein